MSHLAMHARGFVARHLLEGAADPRTPEGLAEALAGWPVELTPPSRAGKAWTVDVVVPSGGRGGAQPWSG